MMGKTYVKAKVQTHYSDIQESLFSGLNLAFQYLPVPHKQFTLIEEEESHHYVLTSACCFSDLANILFY